MIHTPFKERDAGYYDRIYASGYSTRSYQPVYDAVLRFLAHMPDPRVLEVGCGTGDLGVQICRRGIDYRGFDISPVAVDRCRVSGLDAVILGSAYDPERYQPQDYSVIIALEVFEHIDDRRAIAQFPPGVHVLFSVPDFVETSHLRAYQDPQRDIVDYFSGLLGVGQILPFKFVSSGGQMLTIRLAHAVVGAACTNPVA